MLFLSIECYRGLLLVLNRSCVVLDTVPLGTGDVVLFFGTVAVVLDVDVVGAQMSAAAGVFLLFLHETQCFSVVSLAMKIRTRVFALEGYE